MSNYQTLESVFKSVQHASRSLVKLSKQTVNDVLNCVSNQMLIEIEHLLTENKKDLDRMLETDPKYDRLTLTEQRIKDIAAEIKNVALLPSPLGKLIESRTMENGMHIRKVTVPMGVIGIIYEARPNVTADVFSLCIKSGNACILKGGSDASFSNAAIVSLIKSVLKQFTINENCIELLPPTREAATALLQAVGYVDVIIPRGSQHLINYVRENAKVPVIETGAGIVHAFFDETGDLEIGKAIVFNAKTRRVSVCNALDCLIIHNSRLPELTNLVQQLANKNVMLYADETAYKTLENNYPPNLLAIAAENHFGTEFLDYKMSIKTVAGINEAIEHIAKFSSKHSETILSENEDNIAQFLNEVDAAVVYANVSTAFTDGAQFGLGAEIGISTQKLHARGPMALAEICSYKWMVTGDGQIRK